jgi:hypothetical protein
MKKNRLIPILLIIICLLPGFSTVKAGFDPSPFRSEERKLNSIGNSLAAFILSSGELAGWHMDPPDHPGYLKGKANQLKAMIHKMGILDNRLSKVLEKIPILESNNREHSELISALENILDKAGSIQSKAEFLASSYEDLIDELNALSDAAEGIETKASSKLPCQIIKI